jgi:hypothetical protein
MAKSLMKKMNRILLSFFGIYLLFSSAGVYAQEIIQSSKVATLGDIEVAHLKDYSNVTVHIYAPLSSEGALSDISITGKVCLSGELKSLIVKFSAEKSFIPSGELEISVSEKSKMTLYSSSVQKINKPEKTSYTLTYLNDLDDVMAKSIGSAQATFFMDLFSEKDKAARLGIASEFFELLRDPSR